MRDHSSPQLAEKPAEPRPAAAHAAAEAAEPRRRRRWRQRRRQPLEPWIAPRRFGHRRTTAGRRQRRRQALFRQCPCGGFTRELLRRLGGNLGGARSRTCRRQGRRQRIPWLRRAEFDLALARGPAPTQLKGLRMPLQPRTQAARTLDGLLVCGRDLIQRAGEHRQPHRPRRPLANAVADAEQADRGVKQLRPRRAAAAALPLLRVGWHRLSRHGHRRRRRRSPSRRGRLARRRRPHDCRLCPSCALLLLFLLLAVARSVLRRRWLVRHSATLRACPHRCSIGGLSLRPFPMNPVASTTCPAPPCRQLHGRRRRLRNRRRLGLRRRRRLGCSLSFRRRRLGRPGLGVGLFGLLALLAALGSRLLLGKQLVEQAHPQLLYLGQDDGPHGFVSGKVERLAPIGAALPHLGAVVKEAADGGHAPRRRRHTQHRLALAVDGIDVGPHREDQLHGLTVALPRRVAQRRLA
mmetsp:Transcript_23555/g.76133  ORF Transcript_23555/g.76133 Transcript_23555/m.76133 type:complete len:465 (+) Transcript_23555:1209-2603(+)